MTSTWSPACPPPPATSETSPQTPPARATQQRSSRSTAASFCAARPKGVGHYPAAFPRRSRSPSGSLPPPKLDPTYPAVEAGVGVSLKTLQIPELDSDYFTDD